MRFLFIFLLLTILTTPFNSALAQNRFALLIANQKYDKAVGPLAYPYQDVELIRKALLRLGFENTNIRVVKDTNYRDLSVAINDHISRVAKASGHSVSFIYYSGHGAAKSRVNYLIPVDVPSADDEQIWKYSLELRPILRRLRREAGQATHVVIFDACRNELKLRRKGIRAGNIDKGFVAMGNISGLILAYATAEGTVAKDNGRYAQYLSEELVKPVELKTAFNSAHWRLLNETGQEAWMTNPATRPLYLAGAIVPPPSVQNGGDNKKSFEIKQSIKPYKKKHQSVESALYQHGYKFQDCEVCPKMIVIKGGAYTMGSSKSEKGSSDNERPQHKVSIKQFAVGQYQVTFSEWDACVKDGGCNGHKPEDVGWGRGARPVIYVSWNDARSYVKWLNQKTGQHYRLLSEAEWEYVASTGSTWPFWWGRSIGTDRANYNGNYTYGSHATGLYRKKTLPVDSFQPNLFGLYNVHGNVWEWVEDCWHKNYNKAPANGSAWGAAEGGDCSVHVLRGGAWYSTPRRLRLRARNSILQDVRDHGIGFRVAMTLARH